MGNIDKSPYIALLIVSSNPIEEKCPLNYHIPYRRISILFLISITLVFSSLYLLPLAYSQRISYISSWSEFGRKETSLSLPEGIAVDQEGNVYVADTGNNRIQVFSSDGTFISKWGRYGRSEVGLRSPADIAIDSSSDNMLVADTENSGIFVFTSRLPTSDESFPSGEEKISGNDTGDQIILSGYLWN